MMQKLDKIKLFMLDMDGTIYLGNRLFDCTLEFLNKLEQKSIEYLFLTNNSSKSKADYIIKLSSLGIKIKESRIMTSGDVTIEYFKKHYPDKSVFLVGTPSLEDSFKAAGIPLLGPDEAFAAVVGFDTGINYYKLNGLYRMVMSGKKYICTHPDLVCPTESGFIPDIGATIAYIKALTGRDPDLIIGKPSDYMIQAAADRFSLAVSDIAMVGDRLYTDIKMAADSGAVSILVLSGETSLLDLEKSEIKPDYVMTDLSEITKVL